MDLYRPTDVEVAADRFHASCGHAALAAILGREVCDVWQAARHEFEGRAYVSGPAMENALSKLRPGNWRPGAARGQEFPVRGLVLMQFEGPWMARGLPLGAQLAHTHWIATVRSPENIMVYDINNRGGEWMSRGPWEWETLRDLLAHQKRATGWHVRRSYEVQPVLLSVNRAAGNP